MTTTTVAAWLLTYLIHSTVFLGGALVFSRVMGGRRLAAQEVLLRTALVGGILTATLQLVLGISPITGVFALGATPPPEPVGPISVPLAAATTAMVATAAEAGHADGVGWTSVLLAVWGLASAAALIAVLRSILDLRRLLQTRCFQPTGRLMERLAAAVGLRRPVRLSTSKAIAVPFATGIRRPEICCPERVNELAREHRTGLFAHELAHLARRDPAWQLAYRLGEALFALQPLNRPVRRRLEEIAEHLTDERAAAGTGDRLGLARCLVVVAHWGHFSPVGLPATGLAAGPRLDRRIRHLISGTSDHASTGRWAVVIGVALLVGSVSILPAVGPETAHAEVASTPDAGSPTWSTSADRPADAGAESVEPAPPAPDPPAPRAAPSPESSPAPPTPSSAPTEPAPQTAPVPEAAPAPDAAPVPPTAPVPPVPAAGPASAERERERESARCPAAEQARERASTEEREHTREASRAKVECARRLAEQAARQARAADAEREALRLEIRERQIEAQRLAREEMVAERDRARALAEEARTRIREKIIEGEELTAVQREELRRRVRELQAQTERQSREAADAAREEARVLAEQARRLAEQAEAERLEREKNEQ